MQSVSLRNEAPDLRKPTRVVFGAVKIMYLSLIQLRQEHDGFPVQMKEVFVRHRQKSEYAAVG